MGSVLSDTSLGWGFLARLKWEYIGTDIYHGTHQCIREPLAEHPICWFVVNWNTSMSRSCGFT